MKQNGVSLRQLVEINPTNSNKYENAHNSNYHWRPYFNVIETIFDTDTRNINNLKNEFNKHYEFSNYSQKLNSLVSDLKTNVEISISANNNFKISNPQGLRLDGSLEQLQDLTDKLDFEYNLDIQDISQQIVAKGINSTAKMHYNQQEINFPIPTITVPRVELKFNKIWRNTPEAEKTDVTVSLLAKDEDGQMVNIYGTGTKTLKAPNWEDSFTDLPQFTQEGRRIRYGVKDESISNQQSDFEVQYFYNVNESFAEIENAKVSEITISNSKSKSELGSFKINKTNGNAKPLQGAKFTLSRRVDNVPEADLAPQDFKTIEKITDGVNKTTFDKLPAGVYTLEETEAPRGYLKSDKKSVVIVQKTGRTYIVDEAKYIANPENYPVDSHITAPIVDIDETRPPVNLDGKIVVTDYQLFKKNEPYDSVDPSKGQALTMKAILELPDNLVEGDTFTLVLDKKLDMRGVSLIDKTQVPFKFGNETVAEHTNSQLIDGKNQENRTVKNGETVLYSKNGETETLGVLKILNERGKFPTTGGMGTTIYTIIGFSIMSIALIVLRKKKEINNAK